MTRDYEKVNLLLGDNFSSGIARAKEAAKSFGDALALAHATWEPHDWSTF